MGTKYTNRGGGAYPSRNDLQSERQCVQLYLRDVGVNSCNDKTPSFLKVGAQV